MQKLRNLLLPIAAVVALAMGGAVATVATSGSNAVGAPLATTATTTPVTGTVLFDGTQISSWPENQSASPSRTQMVPDPDGQGGQAQQFTTLNSDVAPLTPTVNPRSQLVTPYVFKPGNTYWESFEIYVPQSFVFKTNGWTSLESAVYGGPYNGTSPATISTENGDFRFQRNGYAPNKWQIAWQTPITKGQWYRFTWHFDFASNGWVSLYVNDVEQPLNNPTTGTTLQLPVNFLDASENKGPWMSQEQLYYQLGLYPSTSLYFKNYKLATTQAAAEGSNPTPPPTTTQTTTTTTTTPTTTTTTTPTTTTTGTTTTPTPPSTIPPPDAPVPTKTLVFDDEFNKSSINTSVWNDAGYTNNNMGPTGGSKAANVSDVGGNLLLQVGTGNTGGQVESKSFGVTVGEYAQASVYFSGSGAQIDNWPAWWISGPNWPNAGESDIAEGYNGTLTVNYHSPAGASNGPTVPGNWAGAFHTYGIYRTAKEAYVYWDGKLVRQYATDDNGQPEYLIFTNGPGNHIVTGAAGEVKVGYVRVWK